MRNPLNPARTRKICIKAFINVELYLKTRTNTYRECQVSLRLSPLLLFLEISRASFQAQAQARALVFSFSNSEARSLSLSPESLVVLSSASSCSRLSLASKKNKVPKGEKQLPCSFLNSNYRYLGSPERMPRRGQRSIDIGYFVSALEIETQHLSCA